IAKGRAMEMLAFALEADKDDLEVKLQPGRILRVRIVDPDGQPIAKAWLEAKIWRQSDSPEWRGETDADGRVTWTDAPADEVRYGVYKPGFIQLTSHPLVANDVEQTLTLARELKVAGVVTDAHSGQPIERFRVVPGWLTKGMERTFWDRERAKATVWGN